MPSTKSDSLVVPNGGLTSTRRNLGLRGVIWLRSGDLFAQFEECQHARSEHVVDYHESDDDSRKGVEDSILGGQREGPDEIENVQSKSWCPGPALRL